MKWDSIVAVEYNDESEDTIIKESKAVGPEVQRLLDKWRQKNKALREVDDQTDFGLGMAKGREIAANELEEVLKQ